MSARDVGGPADSDALKRLYGRRFDARERLQRDAIWKVLCHDFLQRYVTPTDVVLDIGAGSCEFINNIRCARKFAIDLNDDTRRHAAPDVTVFVGPASDLSALPDETVHVAFASNFFEHLPNKDDLMRALRAIHRVLQPGGRLLILQPNIRYAYKEYWDFFDHHLPLSHLSLTEALGVAGFSVREVRPRFLPYTTKSRLPKSGLLLRLYLRIPLLHWFLGKQMFLVASKE